jgi:dethiobiotin synthetase
MKGLMVLGTDTGVGKTHIVASLVSLLGRMGGRAVPFKPIETGIGGGGVSDARRLLDAVKENGRALDGLEVSDICLYSFKEPVAPALAAEWAGVEISEERIVERAETLGEGQDFLIVESAGALLTPISGKRTNLDLAIRLGLPVLLVGRNGLGTISQTCLAIGEIQRRGLGLVGVFLSTTTSGETPDQKDNARLIERATECEVTTLPFLESVRQLAELPEILALARTIQGL